MSLGCNLMARDFTATSEDGLVFHCDKLPGGECSITWLTEDFRSLSEINIPEVLFDGETNRTVTEIGRECFWSMHSLKSVTFPKTLRVMLSSAFEGCDQLSSIEIPDGVTRIDGRVFANCALKEVYIPESVTSIGSNAFSCSTLERVEFSSLERLFQFNFRYVDENPLCDAHHLYISGEEVTDLIVPESITTIRPYTLSGCLGLKSLHIPATVKKVSYDVVSGCVNLKEVHFSDLKSLFDIRFDERSHLLDNVEHLYIGGKESNALEITEDISTIGDYALANCKCLTSLKLSETVTTVGTGSFKGCSNLSSLTLPQSVEYLGDYAFMGCKLRAIQILATEPPSIGSTSFSGQSTYHTTLYVPQGHFDDYAYDDTYWYRFINIKEFVGESASLSSNAVYSIKDNDAGGFMVYDAVNGCLGSIDVDTNIDNNALSHNWQVVKQGGSTMLYNLEAKRYLSQQTDGTWGLTSEAQAISLSDGGHGCIALDGKGEWMFVVNPSLAAPIPDGIEDVQADAQQDGPVYDLMGRVRNADSRNEILIKNGRKMIIR